MNVLEEIWKRIRQTMPSKDEWTTRHLVLCCNGIFTSLIAIRLVAVLILYHTRYFDSSSHRRYLAQTGWILLAQMLCVAVGTLLIQFQAVAGAIVSTCGFILYVFLDDGWRNGSPYVVSVLLGALLLSPSVWNMFELSSETPVPTLRRFLQGLVVGCNIISIGVCCFESFVTAKNIRDVRQRDYQGEDAWVDFQQMEDKDYQGLLWQRLAHELFTIMFYCIGIWGVAHLLQNDMKGLQCATAGGLFGYILKVSASTGHTFLDTTCALALALPLVFLISVWSVESFSEQSKDNGKDEAIFQQLSDEVDCSPSKEQSKHWLHSLSKLEGLVLLANALWFHVVLMTLLQNISVIEFPESALYTVHLALCVFFVFVKIFDFDEHFIYLVAACMLCFVAYGCMGLWWWDLDLTVLSLILALPHGLYLYQYKQRQDIIASLSDSPSDMISAEDV